MGKLYDFLMQDKEETTLTSEVAVSGFPYPFKVKGITEGENKALRKSCQKTTFDKSTHQKSTELDSDLYCNRLVVACCEEPNFKAAALQQKFGVIGAEALVDKIFNPGQFDTLLLAVREVNGFADDVNELRDDAKN